MVLSGRLSVGCVPPAPHVKWWVGLSTVERAKEPHWTMRTCGEPRVSVLSVDRTLSAKTLTQGGAFSVVRGEITAVVLPLRRQPRDETMSEEATNAIRPDTREDHPLDLRERPDGGQELRAQLRRGRPGELARGDDG